MKTAYVSFMIWLLVAAAAHSQQPPCQKYLKDMRAVVAKEHGYELQQKNGDEEFRCEGLYTIGTSGELNLAVVSLTAGPVTYQLSSSLTLDVAMVPGIQISGSIRIRALPQAEGKNYQMDALIPVKSRLVWPGSLLDAAGINASQLGIYGVVKKNGVDVFVPLSVSTHGQPVATTAPIRMAVRYPYTLSRLGWKPGRIDTSGECVSTAAYQWIYNAEGRTPIPIDLVNVTGDCLLFRLQRGSGTTTADTSSTTGTSTTASTPTTIRIALPEKH